MIGCEVRSDFKSRTENAALRAAYFLHDEWVPQAFGKRKAEPPPVNLKRAGRVLIDWIQGRYASCL